MQVQRYISDELTHFIGRDLVRDMRYEEERDERDEKLYARLVSILRDGVLLAGGIPPNPEPEKLTAKVQVTYTGKPDLSELFEPVVVCFCDIPVGDVEIHAAKYGPFGLSFNRRFLLAHGVNPVLYLAEDADVEGGKAGKFFAEEMKHTIDFLGEIWHQREDMPNEVSNAANRAFSFLLHHHFPLVKGFRARASDEDPENYYMEREWRKYNDLDFALHDVRRVYLPARFASKFRNDLPDYFVQVTFLD
jgi:hypothetical protein